MTSEKQKSGLRKLLLPTALVNGERMEPFPGGHGICEYCKGDRRVWAHCGKRNRPHWHHEPGSPCAYKPGEESPWHRAWKNVVPENLRRQCTEVPIKNNDVPLQADIRIFDKGEDFIIELQHSPINYDTITKRETNYGRGWWLYDADRFASKEQPWSEKLDFLTSYEQLEYWMKFFQRTNWKNTVLGFEARRDLQPNLFPSSWFSTRPEDRFFWWKNGKLNLTFHQWPVWWHVGEEVWLVDIWRNDKVYGEILRVETEQWMQKLIQQGARKQLSKTIIDEIEDLYQNAARRREAEVKELICRELVAKEERRRRREEEQRRREAEEEVRRRQREAEEEVRRQREAEEEVRRRREEERRRQREREAEEIRRRRQQEAEEAYWLEQKRRRIEAREQEWKRYNKILKNRWQDESHLRLQAQEKQERLAKRQAVFDAGMKAIQKIQDEMNEPLNVTTFPNLPKGAYRVEIQKVWVHPPTSPRALVIDMIVHEKKTLLSPVKVGDVYAHLIDIRKPDGFDKAIALVGGVLGRKADWTDVIKSWEHQTLLGEIINVRF